MASRDLRGVAATSFQGGRTRTLNWYPMGYEEPIGWAGNGVRLKVQSEPETLGRRAVERVKRIVFGVFSRSLRLFVALSPFALFPEAL